MMMLTDTAIGSVVWGEPNGTNKVTLTFHQTLSPGSMGVVFGDTWKDIDALTNFPPGTWATIMVRTRPTGTNVTLNTTPLFSGKQGIPTSFNGGVFTFRGQGGIQIKDVEILPITYIGFVAAMNIGVHKIYIEAAPSFSGPMQLTRLGATSLDRNSMYIMHASWAQPGSWLAGHVTSWEVTGPVNGSIVRKVISQASYANANQLLSVLPADSGAYGDFLCYNSATGACITTTFDASAQGTSLDISITFTKIGGNYLN
ncbi:hypothetical protein OEZ85_000316 [Tetradesmus obliquus]|uniref:Uncharacterized protein n=1 Tax=Tetradesmus obliquus TaxID=3088 RepID=A0ABY8UQ98_TETOB|nr:hypothetical protein OEZ85_000316 [Tetradesmus obliquus]